MGGRPATRPTGPGVAARQAYGAISGGACRRARGNPGGAGGARRCVARAQRCRRTANQRALGVVSRHGRRGEPPRPDSLAPRPSAATGVRNRGAYRPSRLTDVATLSSLGPRTLAHASTCFSRPVGCRRAWLPNERAHRTLTTEAETHGERAR